MRTAVFSLLFSFCSCILMGCGPNESISVSSHTFSYGAEEDLLEGINRLHKVEGWLRGKGFRSVYESHENGRWEAMFAGDYEGIPNIEVTLLENRGVDAANSYLRFEVDATYQGEEQWATLQAFRALVNSEISNEQANLLSLD